MRGLGRDQILDAVAAIVDLLSRSMRTELRRFLWVIALWVIAVLFMGRIVPTIIGLVALLAYWRYFVPGRPKSGSQRTRPWREGDSNRRSPLITKTLRVPPWTVSSRSGLRPAVAFEA